MVLHLADLEKNAFLFLIKCDSNGMQHIISFKHSIKLQNIANPNLTKPPKLPKFCVVFQLILHSSFLLFFVNQTTLFRAQDMLFDFNSFGDLLIINVHYVGAEN